MYPVQYVVQSLHLHHRMHVTVWVYGHYVLISGGVALCLGVVMFQVSISKGVGQVAMLTIEGTLLWISGGFTLSLGIWLFSPYLRGLCFPYVHLFFILIWEHQYLAGWLATGCLFKNSGMATKTCMVSTSNK